MDGWPSWFMALVLKTKVCNSTAGSNPVPSGEKLWKVIG